MACSKTAFIEFKDCESSYLFEVGLTPNTSYFYEITDKFGNVYQKAFTTDVDGYFSISPNDFPPYLFTNAGGNFTLIVKESLTDCGVVDFDYCEDTFDTIVFSFIKNAENGNVPIVDKCQKVYDCLGISESGEANKFLNEQGDFVTVSGFTCSDLSTCSTTNLSEGTRLYFTDGRAVTALTGQNISLLNNDSNYLTSSTASSTYEPIITSGTTSQYYRGDKTFQNLDKSTVGLGDVDNTSDSSKPVSTATQTALDLKANKSEVATVLFKSITQTIVTNKTNETSIYSIPLPIDGGNYIIELFSNSHIATYPGFTQNHRIRCGTYLAPIDGITGANAIGNQTLIFNNQGAGNGIPIYINRTFIFKGGASGSIYSVQSGIAEIYNSATPTTLMSANFTTQHYLYVCFSPVNSGIIQHNFIVIKTIKI